MGCRDQEAQTLIAPCIRVITRYVDGGLTIYDYASFALALLGGVLLGIVVFFQVRRLVRLVRSRRTSSQRSSTTAG